MARRPESELDKFQWWVNVNTVAREAVIALDDLDDLLAENPGPEADWADCKRDLEKAHNKLRAVWDHISRVCEEKKMRWKTSFGILMLRHQETLGAHVHFWQKATPNAAKLLWLKLPFA